MDIEPIRTDEDHKAALASIERLWGAKPGSANAKRLDVLATLVDAYERRRYPLDDADPVDVIKIHMDMTGRTQGDLAALLGSVSRASELLNRKRGLTMKVAYKLHKEWGIPSDALIVPYALARA